MQVFFLLKWFDPKVFIFNFDFFWTDWGGNLNAAKHHARNSDGHNNDVSIKPSPQHHHPTDFHSSKPECVVSKLLLQAKKNVHKFPEFRAERLDCNIWTCPK